MTNPTRRQAAPAEHLNLGRRATMVKLAGSLGVAVPFSILALGRPAAGDVKRIAAAQSSGTPSEFMAQAERMRDLALKRGDQGYGAVIVKDGRIVGEAASRVVMDQDPTAHAEMEAIRAAARNLGTRSLDGCITYSTSRPCPMCEAAAFWARISAMRVGPSIADAGEPKLGRC